MKFKQTAQSVTRVNDLSPVGQMPSGAIVFEVKNIPASEAWRMKDYWLPMFCSSFVFDWSQVKDRVGV